jgi:hypothetical protein
VRGLILLLVLFFFLRPAAAAEMLVVSDLHFNPTANKALVDRLAAAEPEQWPAILAGDTARMSGYGEDSNWKLLASALAAMAAQPKPDFVLITGDFLVHQFRTRFDAAASDHSDAAFRAFAAKTMRFLALQLEADFPAIPILPALGNNDDICGDYALRPGGPFLADTTAVAAGLVGAAADASFRQTWRALGNYVIANPAAPEQRIAVVNTNFFSLHYQNDCGTPADGNPAVATLAWLRGVLTEAEAAHRKVWLAYHIPPGIDAFATARNDICPIAPVPMFAESYAREFHALMARFHDTVTVSFAGHVHTDGFRLISEAGKSFGFVMMNPAISPIFGQNPAFRRVVLGPDGGIADQSVYYLANLPQAQAGTAPLWQLEMSFDAAWDLPRYDVSSLRTLYGRLATSTAVGDRWSQAYAVQSQGGVAIRPADYAIYRCTAGYDRSADFARCSCAGDLQ